MNISDFYQLYRRSVSEKGETGALVYLYLDPIPPKILRVLTHVTVENLTSAFTKCRIGIINGQTVFYIDELTSVAEDELCVSRSDILLGEADRFFAELTGTTDDDDIKMVCIGWDSLI